MKPYADKLNHLKYSHVLFPPQVLLKSGTHGCHQIVEIHDNVNQTIQGDEKATVTANDKSETNPNTQWHNAMMQNVQERDLVVLFAHYEKDGVKKIDNL